MMKAMVSGSYGHNNDIHAKHDEAPASAEKCLPSKASTLLRALETGCLTTSQKVLLALHRFKRPATDIMAVWRVLSTKLCKRLHGLHCSVGALYHNIPSYTLI